MNENSELHIKVINLSFTEEIEFPEPPPPGFISNFNTLEDWLFNLCDTEKPEKPIATFEFGLFEGNYDDILYLVGLNKNNSESHSDTLLDFKPKHMYFSIAINEFKGFDREQLLEKLTCQLKEFTTTDKFRNSFLSKAKSITTSFRGEIWAQ